MTASRWSAATHTAWQDGDSGCVECARDRGIESAHEPMFENALQAPHIEHVGGQRERLSI
jgi:hypothetical protein